MEINKSQVDKSKVSDFIHDRDIVVFYKEDEMEYIVKGNFDANTVFPNLISYKDYSFEPHTADFDLSKSKKLQYAQVSYLNINAKNIDVLRKCKKLTISGVDINSLERDFPTFNISDREYGPGTYVLTPKQKAGSSKPNCKKHGCTVQPRNGAYCSKHK